MPVTDSRRTSPSILPAVGSPEAVVELATEIKRAANPFPTSGSGMEPLGKKAAGVQEVGELRSLLLEVKQSLEPEDPYVKKLTRRWRFPAPKDDDGNPTSATFVIPLVLKAG